MKTNDLFLDKWFLDLCTAEGEAFIIYTASLKWKKLSVPFTSILHYHPEQGKFYQSRYRNVSYPEISENGIYWKDSKFGAEGNWIAKSNPIETKIYNSDNGSLQWNCIQPRSDVELKINGRIIRAEGYVEQLILTAYPWRIPMQELRWGRYVSEKDYLVWIELKEKDKKNWLWWNGEKLNHFLIADDCIRIPEKDMILKMDRNIVLESEKKIHSISQKLFKYLPAFKEVLPFEFLMADETKWLSIGVLYEANNVRSRGSAIHELVDFKSS